MIYNKIPIPSFNKQVIIIKSGIFQSQKTPPLLPVSLAGDKTARASPREARPKCPGKSATPARVKFRGAIFFPSPVAWRTQRNFSRPGPGSPGSRGRKEAESGSPFLSTRSKVGSRVPHAAARTRRRFIIVRGPSSAVCAPHVKDLCGRRAATLCVLYDSVDAAISGPGARGREGERKSKGGGLAPGGFLVRARCGRTTDRPAVKQFTCEIIRIRFLRRAPLCMRRRLWLLVLLSSPPREGDGFLGVLGGRLCRERHSWTNELGARVAAVRESRQDGVLLAVGKF